MYGCSGGVFHKCRCLASHPLQLLKVFKRPRSWQATFWHLKGTEAELLQYCGIADQSPHAPSPPCPHPPGPVVNKGKLTYVSPSDIDCSQCSVDISFSNLMYETRELANVRLKTKTFGGD